MAKDAKKATHHYQLAAIGGSEEARYHLGIIAVREGNFPRAVKHWMLGAEAGDDACMDMIKKGFFVKHVSKQEYETVIRAHGECKDEMWSDNRDKAAVVIDKISQAGMTSPSDFGRMNL